MPTSIAVLELNRVSAGGLHAVSFAVGPGEVVAVVGPVGSGRTTLARVISGRQRPVSGRVVLDGVDVTDVGPADRARFGIGTVWSRPRPFGSLTVEQNVAVVAGSDPVCDRHEALARARGLLERHGLADLAAVPAGRLDAVAAARLEVVRVLAAPRRMIVVDELPAALAGTERNELTAALCATAALGGAVVWLDSPARVRVPASKAVLLLAGRVVAEGPAAEVLATPEFRGLRAQETPDR